MFQTFWGSPRVLTPKARGSLLTVHRIRCSKVYRLGLRAEDAGRLLRVCVCVGYNLCYVYKIICSRIQGPREKKQALQFAPTHRPPHDVLAMSTLKTKPHQSAYGLRLPFLKKKKHPRVPKTRGTLSTLF